MRCLIVEDYPDNARLMAVYLRAIGTIDIAANAAEALRSAEAATYDLFLIDIQLGSGPTGVDLMRALRTDPRYATTPIVACTAAVQPEHRRRLLEAGFDGFLGKPFTKAEILDEVKRHQAACA